MHASHLDCCDESSYYSKEMEHGAQFVDAEGWQVPLVYSSIEDEY